MKVHYVLSVFLDLYYYRTLRKRDISKYHVQLCIAMFSMLLVFLVGINKTSVKGGCVTVSVLIHYFTLASVMWMGAEAVLMFQKLVLVFVRITTRHIIAVSFICWCEYIYYVHSRNCDDMHFFKFQWFHCYQL